MKIIFAFLVVVCSVALADTVTLADNSVWNGEIRFDGKEFKLKSKVGGVEHTYTIDAGSVRRIEFNARRENAVRPPSTLMANRTSGGEEPNHQWTTNKSAASKTRRLQEDVQSASKGKSRQEAVHDKAMLAIDPDVINLRQGEPVTGLLLSIADREIEVDTLSPSGKKKISKSLVRFILIP